MCAMSTAHSKSADTIAPDEIDTEHSVVVKHTFLDVQEGESLDEQCRRMRRAYSDPAFMKYTGGAVYKPGQFSDEQDQELMLMTHLTSSDCPESAPAFSSDTAKANGRTTMMLRNLPNNYTRRMLLELLDSRGFSAKYDFVYLPCDFARKSNLGYAFVNLVEAEDIVDDFWGAFDGFVDWELPTAKVCRVGFSGPHQGLTAHIARYRNSPVMHKSVPDEYKPVILSNGVRQRFPAPTRKIKRPATGTQRLWC
ncbi:ML4 [Symbiodinium natans]|uniref:ML4 protein n=1 Tax=Symbiodinium natans TaxID=878477 RepID=A0A812UBR4_9DINO|nr:ML4 [Symbiodinium natans]